MPGNSRITRILLADDHEIVRRGLRQILTEALRGTSYGEASNPGEIIRIVLKSKWDLVILDSLFPGRNGLEVLKDIRRHRPDLPVLVLSLYTDEQLAIRALRAGASGYLAKQSTSAEIVAAVRKVIAGGRFVTPSLAERLAREIQSGGEKVPHERLSDREFQVFELLAAGLTVKRVAERLNLSAQTVSTHRVRILDKMKMESNADLVRYAAQHHLLDEGYGPVD
ncbi:MAG TPA: response regulator transcription factor [Candidatus Limnocylindrales bacterium]|nr:response regulator transcription factor [Candidatus Limnocylindrales bacterium]